MKIHFAADRRHAETVAIAADPSNHPRHKIPRLGVFRIAEAQCIEASNRARTHGEDIAQDATHAGGRALIGLDK